MVHLNCINVVVERREDLRLALKTLRNHIPNLVTVVLLLLGMMTAATAQAQAAPQQLADSATICSDSPIPAGWVITSAYSSYGCRGSGLAYSISDVTGQTSADHVCSDSRIPAGWVITRSYSSYGCRGSGLAYSISKL